MKCLDSDLLIDFLRGKAEALMTMKELEDEALATTTINQFELLYGAKLSKKSTENLNEVKKLLKNLNIYTFDEKSSEVASTILADLRRPGKIIGMNDVFIAGICRANNLDLVTKNTKHFERISGLNIEEYSV